MNSQLDTLEGAENAHRSVDIEVVKIRRSAISDAIDDRILKSLLMLIQI